MGKWVHSAGSVKVQLWVRTEALFQADFFVKTHLWPTGHWRSTLKWNRVRGCSHVVLVPNMPLKKLASGLGEPERNHCRRRNPPFWREGSCARLLSVVQDPCWAAGFSVGSGKHWQWAAGGRVKLTKKWNARDPIISHKSICCPSVKHDWKTLLFANSS